MACHHGRWHAAHKPMTWCSCADRGDRPEPSRVCGPVLRLAAVPVRAGPVQGLLPGLPPRAPLTLPTAPVPYSPHTHLLCSVLAPRRSALSLAASRQSRAVKLCTGPGAAAASSQSHLPFSATTLATPALLVTPEASIAGRGPSVTVPLLQVCGGYALSLFRYDELERLVCGLPHLDFEALKAAARYEAGYHATHPTMQARPSDAARLAAESDQSVGASKQLP